MKPFAAIFLTLFAFLVFMRGGATVGIPDSVGFIVVETEAKQPVILFLDAKAKPVQAIPFCEIQGMVFVPDGRMM